MLQNHMFNVRNIMFCPDYFETKSQELSDEIMIPFHRFNDLMEEFEDEVLYITVRNKRCDLVYLATLGAPHEGDANVIYMPQWMMDALGLSEDVCGPVELERTDSVEIRMIPVVTRIVLRDPCIAADIRDAVEKAIVNLHSIQEGMEIPIWINDMEMLVYIQTVEPAALSRIVTGEVEFVLHSEPVVPPMIDTSDDEPCVSNVPSVPRASSLPSEHGWNDPTAPTAPTAPTTALVNDMTVEEIRQARLRRFQ